MEYTVMAAWMRSNAVEIPGLSINDIAIKHRRFVEETGLAACLIISDGWIQGSAPLYGMPRHMEDYPRAMRNYLESKGFYEARLDSAEELSPDEIIITLGTRDGTGVVRSLDALDDIVSEMDSRLSQGDAWMEVNSQECALSCAWKQKGRPGNQYEFAPGIRLRIVLGNLDMAQGGLKFAQHIACELMQCFGQRCAIIEYADRAQIIQEGAEAPLAVPPEPKRPAASKPAATSKRPARPRKTTPPRLKEPALCGPVDALSHDDLLREAIELATDRAHGRLDFHDTLGSNQIIGAAYVSENNGSAILSPGFGSGPNSQADVPLWRHIMSEFTRKPPKGFLKWVVFFTTQPQKFVQQVAKGGTSLLPRMDSVLAECLQHWAQPDAGIVFICEEEVLIYNAQDVAHLPTRQWLILCN